MIQTVLRREYVMACDGCGQRSAALSTPAQAHQLAHSQGWKPITTYCAVGVLTNWLCPECQSCREGRRNPPDRLTA